MVGWYYVSLGFFNDVLSFFFLLLWLQASPHASPHNPQDEVFVQLLWETSHWYLCRVCQTRGDSALNWTWRHRSGPACPNLIARLRPLESPLLTCPQPLPRPHLSNDVPHTHTCTFRPWHERSCPPNQWPLSSQSAQPTLLFSQEEMLCTSVQVSLAYLLHCFILWLQVLPQPPPWDPRWDVRMGAWH